MNHKVYLLVFLALEGHAVHLRDPKAQLSSLFCQPDISKVTNKPSNRSSLSYSQQQTTVKPMKQRCYLIHSTTQPASQCCYAPTVLFTLLLYGLHHMHAFLCVCSE